MAGQDDPAEFTYAEVGATGAELPSGYAHLRVVRTLGRGRPVFELAAERIHDWQMHRRSGFTVDASGPVAVGASAYVSLRLGPLRFAGPTRVVTVIDEPDRRGFAYGTLAGHPEIGEERFVVTLGADGVVLGEVVAFSRPASRLLRLLGPFARLAQRVIARRYLRALVSP